MDKKNFVLSQPVLRRSGGRWYFEFYKVFASGTRQRVKISAGINYGKTDEEKQQLADEWLAWFPDSYQDAMAARRKHSYPRVDEFLFVKSMGWEGRTFETYSGRIKIFCEWWYKQHFRYPPERAKYYDAIAFMLYLKEDEDHLIGETTWNCYRSTLFEMYAWWKVKDNPFTEIKVFHDTKTPQKIFTKEQRKLLWEHVKQDRPELTVYIGLIFYCFLRPPNEIRNLKIGDIDFNEQTIFVNRRSSKTKRKRLPRLPDVFVPYVKHLQKFPNDWYAVGKGLKPGPVPCHIGFLIRTIRRLLDRFGFDHRYSSYSWRHGAAADLMKQHRDIHLLQHAMGHSSVRTTEIYTQNMEVMIDERLNQRNEM